EGVLGGVHAKLANLVHAVNQVRGVSGRSSRTWLNQVRGVSGGPARGDGLEAAADLVGVGADVVDARKGGQRLEAENALEERRGAVPDRAGFLAAVLGDQAALDEPGDDAVDVHAADARDFGPRDGAEVRD